MSRIWYASVTYPDSGIQEVKVIKAHVKDTGLLLVKLCAAAGRAARIRKRDLPTLRISDITDNSQDIMAAGLDFRDWTFYKSSCNYLGTLLRSAGDSRVHFPDYVHANHPSVYVSKLELQLD